MPWYTLVILRTRLPLNARYTTRNNRYLINVKKEKEDGRIIVNIILIIEIIYVFFMITVNNARKLSSEFNSIWSYIHTFMFGIGSLLHSNIHTFKLVQNFLSHTWVSYVWARVSDHHMIYIHSCHIWLWRMVVVFMKPAVITSRFYRQNLNLTIICHDSIETLALSDVIR